MTNKEIISSLRGLIGKYNLTDEEWQTIEKTIKVLNNSDKDRLKGVQSIQPKTKTDVLDKIRAVVIRWQTDTWTDNLSLECMRKIADILPVKIRNESEEKE